MKNNEQHLIDIMFSCIMMIQYPEYRNHFDKMTNEELAEWARQQLDGCGYYTEPKGMSWAVLTNKKSEKDFTKLVESERFE